MTGVVRQIWSALGFAFPGGGLYLNYAPTSSLVQATPMDTAAGISTLVSSLLLVACAVAVAWSLKGEANVWAGSAVVIVYAVTAFTVTAGVLVGGEGGGFFAGHMAATICWIAMAAALFIYAARLPKTERSVAGWRWSGLRWPNCSYSTSAPWTASSASWCSSSSGWYCWAWGRLRADPGATGSH